MEALSSSETSVLTRFTRFNISEYVILYKNRVRTSQETHCLSITVAQSVNEFSKEAAMNNKRHWGIRLTNPYVSVSRIVSASCQLIHCLTRRKRAISLLIARRYIIETKSL
jgi:Na+-transporting NADH:ubiquinone oxidoreductase subunit NqrB